MGRSTTPAYVVEYECEGTRRISPICWRVTSSTQVPADGRPTAANLRKHVESYNRSFQPGGANAHVGVRIVAAKLLRNDGSREVVATCRVGA